MGDLIDPAYRSLLEERAATGIPPRHALSVAGAREAITGGPKQRMDPIRGQRDIRIPGPGGDIPVRLYFPEGTGPHPVLVYLHGGGWVRGTIDAVDAKCRALSHKSGCLVASVGYRRAPEHPFPAAVQDARAAVTWLHENAETVQGDPDRLGVGGMSAGGNLAAVMALWCRDHGDIELSHQLLLNPVTAYHPDFDSYRRFDRTFWSEHCPPGAGGYPLSLEDMVWYWDHYLRDDIDGEHPYAAPLRAPDVGNTAPATVVTCELDPLRDEGRAYADRLADASVPVDRLEYDGVFHSFLAVFSELERADEALSDVAASVAAALDAD